MISFLLTFVLIFLAVICAFYLGAYARCQDDWTEFWHAVRWSWKHELGNIIICKLALMVMALLFATIFHMPGIRDIIVS